MNTSDEYSKWTLYDSIVQSYRSNMIASQSLLLAVAAIMVEKNSLFNTVICIIGLIQLWYVWFRVIRSRTIISDFHKFNAQYGFCEKINTDGDLRSTSNPANLTEEIYVSNSKIRNKANNQLAIITGEEKLRTNFRTTRKKLDYFLPFSFTIIWLMFLLFPLSNCTFLH